jgi:hypothetical protein
MSFHPPLDIARFDLAAPNAERKVAFFSLDQLPVLSLSNNSFHFLRLDILVQLPFAQA